MWPNNRKKMNKIAHISVRNIKTIDFALEYRFSPKYIYQTVLGLELLLGLG